MGIRNGNIAVNIAADGLATAVIQSVTDTQAGYRNKVKTYLAEYLQDTTVGTMLFNVFYKRSVTDSDTVDSVLYNIQRNADGEPLRDENGNVIKHKIAECTSTPLYKGYWELAERKIDIIQMSVEETHRYGAQAWLSLRMNDHHDAQEPLFNSSFHYDHPEKYGLNGARDQLDYSRAAVRKYHKEYIKEIAVKYDVDGIELDFLRTCPIMADVTQRSIDLMNGYVAEIKRELKQHTGRDIRLSARVYPEEEENLRYGIDAAQWIADGSIDTLVAEGWYIPTYYRIPVDRWRRSIDAKNISRHPYRLLAGTDWAVRCDSRRDVGYMMWITLEQFKGFASSAYARGADGVYLFNHFAPWTDYGAFTRYIDEKGNKILKNIFKEKMVAADSQTAAERGVRTYVHTCRDYYNDVYPAPVSREQGFEALVNSGSRPSSGFYRIVVGLDEMDGVDDDPLVVTVNGANTLQIADVPREKGFVWRPMDRFEPIAEHVSEVAFRVMQFVPEHLSVIRDGDNRIVIKSREKDQLIKWLEIQVCDDVTL